MHDLMLIRDNFRQEIEKAVNGDSSSLPFIKTTFSHKKDEPPPEYQVMVIGGTNFSTARVIRAGINVDLLDIKKERLELFKNSEELFSFISKKLDEDIEVVCLNLAFPLEPIIREDRLDGVFMNSTKEHKMDDLIGKKIGEEIENYAFKNLGRKVKVSVANDAVCLLLSGISVTYSEENIVGLILGTGFNMGMFIDKNTVVNLEAACFDKFPQSAAGKEIDGRSHNSGEYVFEKEIAGAYLYQHFNYLIEQKKLDAKPIDSTEELYEIFIGNSENNEAINAAKEIFRRSAQLVAAVLAGLAQYKNSEIEVITQGGLFTNEYKEMLMNAYEEMSIHSMRFYKIENSSRIGAAYLI